MADSVHVGAGFVYCRVYVGSGSIKRLAGVASNYLAITVDQNHIGCLEHAEMHLLSSQYLGLKFRTATSEGCRGEATPLVDSSRRPMYDLEAER